MTSKSPEKPTVLGRSFEIQVAVLKRKLENASLELQTIVTQGRAALRDAKEIPQFKAMFKGLERYFIKLDSTYDDIGELFDVEGKIGFPYKNDKLTYDSGKRYYHEIHSIYDKLNVPTSSSGSDTSQLDATLASLTAAAHLPQLPELKFDGQLSHWPKFRDSFKSVVHDDAGIPTMKKFQFLSMALSGHAAAKISHLPLITANYELAWEALVKAYDNKRLLASSYLNNLLDVPTLSSKPISKALNEYITTVTENVSAFRLLNIPNADNFILYYLVFRSLDKNTRERLEIHVKSKTFPSIDDLTEFISDQCRALELADYSSMRLGTTSLSSSSDHQGKSPHTNNNTKRNRNHYASLFNQYKQSDGNSFQRSRPPTNPCYACNKMHLLIECPTFNSGNAVKRKQILHGFTGCYNCLSSSHNTKSCSSQRRCRICSGMHHSLLHTFNQYQTTPKQSVNTNKTPDKATKTENTDSTPIVAFNSKPDNEKVFLATALVRIDDAFSNPHFTRAVADCGSQRSCMSLKLAKALNLPITRCNAKLSGIGQVPYNDVRGKVNCVLYPSNCDEPKLHVEALVLDKVTPKLPNFTFGTSLIEPYLQFELADPNFWKPDDVQFLFGAEVFPLILSSGTHQIAPNTPLLISTIFGDLVMGSFSGSSTSTNRYTSLLSTQPEYHTKNLDFLLKQFWEIEETTTSSKSNSHLDEYAEDHFAKTHERDETGRYIVRLPFKSSPEPVFEGSAPIAMKRFRNLEFKLSKNPNLKTQYVDFMTEYSDLGHMSETSSPSNYVIPHHSVMKDEKIRVVFDASASSSRQQGSLNDHLIIGPKLQNESREILMNFRVHRFVFTADMIKMFRQILIHPADRCYQHVFWRSDPSTAIKTFELNTITYGMSPAPYLAQRTIKQLQADEGHAFPLAAQVITRDIYVDDLATGAQTKSKVKELKSQTIALLEKGGFKLSKWSSNDPELIKTEEKTPNSNRDLCDSSDCIKILGLQWDSQSDNFRYKISSPLMPTTKRGLLSLVARIYDPLGWLAPVVVLAKSFIQELWKLGFDWDEEIPIKLYNQWKKFSDELDQLSSIQIPRWIATNDENKAQIVGFCDASTIAYSATIYIRIMSSEDIKTYILTAKTRLAPVKIISVPRLELCGALLLAKVYSSIQSFIDLLPIPCEEPIFFSDSQIVLTWINTPSYKLKTFVANRVTEITSLTPANRWYHVGSKENPSDLSSRGLLPSALINNILWWCGPEWLHKNISDWPINSPVLVSDIPEIKSNVEISLSTTTETQNLLKWMSDISSFTKIINVIGYCMRFYQNSSLVKERLSGPLTLMETLRALRSCIHLVQCQYYFNGNTPDASCIPQKFAKLCPFLDAKGILRVGGRLSQSDLPEATKHPIILPGESHFTIALIDYYHQKYMHPGPQFLQALIQIKYWIPSLRKITRQRTFNCITCYKGNAANKFVTPIMADLPSYRVRSSRAFLNCGVDFAGPFQLKHSLLRKSVISKCYLCVFVCMATKALHLEVVSDLSTNAFLACLTRFTSRRGFPQRIFSDQGSNFLGAEKQLRELTTWFRTKKVKEDIVKFSTDSGFTWTFNPPYGPHFGGIWEAGVKSSKTIIRKVVGDTPLTFEEWSTLFGKVESVLNSRPLCPLSISPEENDFLTPGHFLIGDHMTTPPEPSLINVSTNRLNRWQLVKQLSEKFWKRWSMDYLITLQARNKWNQGASNLKVNDLVLLREDYTHSLHWPTGRISEIHPGKDGVVRVVTLKTGSTEYVRPVHKLVPLLPLNEP